jgi:hypothetical protein
MESKAVCMSRHKMKLCLHTARMGGCWLGGLELRCVMQRVGS